jgi:hypothetical protein
MNGHPTPSSFTSCVSGSSLCRDAGSSLQFKLCGSSPCQLWVSYRMVSMEMSVMWTSRPRRHYDKRSVSPVFVLGVRKPDAAAAVLLRFCRTAPKESEGVRNERTQQGKSTIRCCAVISKRCCQLSHQDKVQQPKWETRSPS